MKIPKFVDHVSMTFNRYKRPLIWRVLTIVNQLLTSLRKASKMTTCIKLFNCYRMVHALA